MSRETIEHLNTHTLIGGTEWRGNAWHYRAEAQGAESNHYPRFIPVSDVDRRLFNFTAQPAEVYVKLPATLDDMTGLDDEGHPFKMVLVPNKKAITHSAEGTVFNIFTDSYTSHQYSEWLLGAVSNLLSDTLNITSAGLLRQGAIAWVEVSVPDTVRTPEGVTFRPNLLAVTSHDGSMSTTYKRTITNTVCDNTMAMALRESGATFKVRHSRHSAGKLAGAADALDIVQEAAEDFEAQVAALCATTVTNKQWQAFLDSLSPIGESKGRGQTLAIGKQDALKQLYTHDERVSPWAGTAWGVVQAVNTWEHHTKVVKTVARAERNMLRTVAGDFDALDANTVQRLNVVLAG